MAVKKKVAKKKVAKKTVAKKVTKKVATKNTKKKVAKKVTKNVAKKTTKKVAKKPATKKAVVKRTPTKKRSELKEKDSDSPWVTIVGEEVDKKKGIKIELDWNEAFIVYLREAGITGSNDEAVVQHWLAMLYKDLMDKMVDGDDSEFS